MCSVSNINISYWPGQVDAAR